ncbi:LysR family transcriptional regulator [Actinacidiphila guanduensis]|uniref:LysR family transcriptional regulator n=1 Tax=Actinacidiphila guanduensis TaxID=310781 RepID=UPI000B877030|nr:LysR family transcriptional regulator [Actinacidiphila guanduensis]
MELRQLRYFVAVAQELHFGRAAMRVHISGPALSQQIIALERDLGAQLFVRDRRTVQLTAAGEALLEDARRMLALADDARRRVRRTAAEAAPLRLGYVSWLPQEAGSGLGVPLRIDEWVLPSHVQADRVAEGSLDLALAWLPAAGAARRGLAAHLVRAEALTACAPGAGSGEAVPAAGLTVLVDTDEWAWSSWNAFAAEFAADTGAALARIDDGGVTGEAFYGHVRQLGGPVLGSPKRHLAVMPPTLARRPIAAPTPVWTWSLLHRADDDRPAVRTATAAFLALSRAHAWPTPPPAPFWLPADDPHRAVLTSVS